MRRRLLCPLAVLIVTSCASLPLQKIPPDEKEVRLALPPAPKGLLSFRDPSILHDLEIGSPASLTRAVSKIPRATISRSDSDRLLIALASGIMDMAWKDGSLFSMGSRTSDQSADFPDNNPYIGSLNSARAGVYDSNSGKKDFLSLTLPSLVLLTPSRQTDYYAEAEEALGAALSMNPDSVLALYLSGILASRMGKYTESLAYFQHAYELEPDCFQTSLALCSAYKTTGRTREAAQFAADLLKAHPGNTAVLKLCADTAFSLGNYDLAEQYADTILKKEPENAEYLLFKVRVYLEKGDYIRASPIIDAYGRTMPSSRDYLILKARIQQEWNKNSAAAAATMENALTRYPDDEEVILYAAKLANETQKNIAGKSADELASMILEQDPANQEALSVRISELIQRKEWNHAYEESHFLQSLQGQFPTVQSQLRHIQICLQLNYLTEASRLAYALYEEHSEDEAVATAYLTVLASEGRSTAMSSIIEQRLPHASQSFKSFLYFQRGMLKTNPAERLSDFRSSLSSNPRNENTLYQLYLLYYRQADYRKARYYLRQALAQNPGDEQLMQLSEELEKKL